MHGPCRLGGARGRDGIGRGRETSGGLSSWKRPCRHSSEAVFADPPVGTRLRDIDRLRPSSQCQSDARVVGAGRSHVVQMDDCIFCGADGACMSQRGIDGIL